MEGLYFLYLPDSNTDKQGRFTLLAILNKLL